MPERATFTLEEANALIPVLEALVGRQLGWQSEIEDRLGALTRLLGEPPVDLTLSDDDPEPISSLKRDLIVRVKRYQEGWREVEAIGVVVKDARIGLLDFYGQVEGKPVWLCWKYGEPEIGFYHTLEEGFSGRKPLRPSVRSRLLN